MEKKGKKGKRENSQKNQKLFKDEIIIDQHFKQRKKRGICE